MKKITTAITAFILLALCINSFTITSCNKPSNPSTADSGYVYFHMHTNIGDSTIGGNTDGADSNAAGPGALPWNYDTLGRRLLLTVPQFFVSNIVLMNATGSMVPLNNVVLLKGLDSEVYYCCKVPIGTYTSAMFNIGISSTNNALPPSTLFITDNIPYPSQATMALGTMAGYYGMVIKGQYDTTTAHSGLNPINFSLSIPNSITNTTQNMVMLPTRGTGAYSNYPVYILTKGGSLYVHILCDYSKLLSIINLKTSYQTDGMSLNPNIADSIANNIPNMIRYEE